MVRGYGDPVGYERLVRDIAKKSIDKTMRFTDWSKRLLEKQIDYALGDVTHLRKYTTGWRSAWMILDGRTGCRKKWIFLRIRRPI